MVEIMAIAEWCWNTPRKLLWLLSSWMILRFGSSRHRRQYIPCRLQTPLVETFCPLVTLLDLFGAELRIQAFYQLNSPINSTMMRFLYRNHQVHKEPDSTIPSGKKGRWRSKVVSNVVRGSSGYDIGKWSTL
jgi:hypothetical protein